MCLYNMLNLVLRTSLQVSHSSKKKKRKQSSLPSSIGTVWENKQPLGAGTTLRHSWLEETRRDVLNCILQRSRSPFLTASALCAESTAHWSGPPASTSSAAAWITAGQRGEAPTPPHPDHQAFDEADRVWRYEEWTAVGGGRVLNGKKA